MGAIELRLATRRRLAVSEILQKHAHQLGGLFRVQAIFDLRARIQPVAPHPVKDAANPDQTIDALIKAGSRFSPLLVYCLSFSKLK